MSTSQHSKVNMRIWGASGLLEDFHPSFGISCGISSCSEIYVTCHGVHHQRNTKQCSQHLPHQWMATTNAQGPTIGERLEGNHYEVVTVMNRQFHLSTYNFKKVGFMSDPVCENKDNSTYTPSPITPCYSLGFPLPWGVLWIWALLTLPLHKMMCMGVALYPSQPEFCLF